MKLLYISTLDHIVRVMLPHLDHARDEGWDVHVACQFTRFRDEVSEHADVLHHVPIQRNPLDPRNLKALVQLIKIIKTVRPDIIHCHNPSGGFYGRLAATLSGTKALRVYTAHGFHFHPLGSTLTNFVYKTIESFAGRFLSDAVFTINRWDFEEAKKLMPSERVFLTHGVGVSTDTFAPSAAPQKEGLVLTCIGELIPRKNQKDAIDAFLKIAPKLPPQAKLVLVGDGKDEAVLREKAGANPQIVFAGFRRDTKELLASSDIFLFPSQQEGLPCAVQEALSMEVPVVCYNVRGCEDMVDESCGRVVAFGDTEALAAVLAELAALTPEARKELGKAGRAKMIRDYSRAACVAEWWAIYAKLRERRR